VCCLILLTSGISFLSFNDQLGGASLLKFGSRNFKDMLIDIHTKPFAVQKQILKEKILEWHGDYNQIDDMLVMVFRLS
jgi:serine phosphatase RsbU (regulator of sigma subunit)